MWPTLRMLPVLALTGCAYVTAQPLTGPNDTTTSGIRVHEVKPILVISNQTVEVKFIPNPDRGYAIKFGAFLAKNNVTLELENSVFKKITADMDSTRFVQFLETVGKAAIENAGPLAALGGPAEGDAPRSVWIYEFVFDGEGGIKELKLLAPLGAAPAALSIPPPPDASSSSRSKEDGSKPSFDGG